MDTQEAQLSAPEPRGDQAHADDAAPRPLFVAISRFVVANDLADDVGHAFVDRPHEVDSAAGFVRMEVLRGGEEDKEFVLLTWWESPADYRTWHRSHDYKASHAGIPKGLRLVKGQTRISEYRQIAT